MESEKTMITPTKIGMEITNAVKWQRSDQVKGYEMLLWKTKTLPMDGLIKSPNVDQTIGDLQDSGEANGGQLLNGGKPRPKAEINQSRLEEETEVKLAIRGGI